MGRPEALIDTNVLVAAAAEAHPHHVASFELILNRPAETFAVAAHAYAETYSTLTRDAAAYPFRWTPKEAWAVIEAIAARTVLVGLTPGETFDAVRAYSEAGGIGPRLYDHLIGHVAARHGIPKIVTWNVRHMRSLFPALEVVAPPSVC